MKGPLAKQGGRIKTQNPPFVLKTSGEMRLRQNAFYFGKARHSRATNARHRGMMRRSRAPYLPMRNRDHM
jgi:hypothetical protein